MVLRAILNERKSESVDIAPRAQDENKSCSEKL